MLAKELIENDLWKREKIQKTRTKIVKAKGLGNELKIMNSSRFPLIAVSGMV